MSRCRLKPCLFVFGLFLALVFGFYFLAYGKKPTQTFSSPSPTPSSSPFFSPTPSPTPQFSNWRLYQNPKYDYQFKYDSQWNLTDTVPGHLRYDTVLLQRDNDPLIEIGLVPLTPKPITVEELLDRLKTEFNLPTSLFKTVNFGRQQIYGVRLSLANKTSYYFILKGLTFKITFYGYSFARLPQAQLHFLQTFFLN